MLAYDDAVDITVEAEIGHVGGAEKPEDGWKEIEADSSMYTRPDDAVDFVARTGVDALAVAIGSVHGVYRGTPKLDIEHLKELRKAVDIPLVMHGGSGLPDSAFRAAIENGISKINFFTGMSLAATETVREKLKEAGDRKMYLQELHIPAKQTMVDIMKRMTGNSYDIRSNTVRLVSLAYPREKNPLGRIFFPIPLALFHPLLPMNIPDRKSFLKPDTQFHTSPFISCRPMAAERGHVRWNPDLLRE